MKKNFSILYISINNPWITGFDKSNKTYTK